jgi:hypothetical protein
VKWHKINVDINIFEFECSLTPPHKDFASAGLTTGNSFTAAPSSLDPELLLLVVGLNETDGGASQPEVLRLGCERGALKQRLGNDNMGIFFG